MGWSLRNLGDQSNKTVLITGANSGIGFEAAKALAENGAHVIMACRNEEKAKTAIDKIKKNTPNAQLHFLQIDLSDQQSIKKAATQFIREHKRLNILINNAGVMWLPRTITKDGYEMHLGTNHLGHFTLTGLLLNLLLKTAESRIVTVASFAHRTGRIHFKDINFEKSYGKQKAYAQSKLANLMFSNELQRRLNHTDTKTLSIAVHPGLSSTNLAIPGFEMQNAGFKAKLATLITPMVTQDAANGSLPTLYAATSKEIKGGDYIGPKHLFEIMGPPAPAYTTRYSKNKTLAKQLWELSEKLTGISYSELL